jgi:HEAT repeat protein
MFETGSRNRTMSSRRTRWPTGLLIAALAGCAEDPMPTLLGQAASANAEERADAVRSLGELGAGAETAVPALINATRDEDRDVRRAACRSLGEIGDFREAALSALLARLEDEEFPVQLAAAFALLKLDPQGRAYVPALTRAMRRGEGGTIVAVGRLGRQAEWAVPTLVDLLRDRRPGVRRLAAEALGRIGLTEEAAEALRKASRDPDDRVRRAAEAALAAARSDVPQPAR